MARQKRRPDPPPRERVAIFLREKIVAGNAHSNDVRLVYPGEGDDYWQPVPANGHISVHIAPKFVHMDNPIAVGTQTVAPGCYVREHAHDRHEEIIHCISGSGKVLIENEEHRLVAGLTIFLGKSRRHKFVNDSDAPLTFLWIMTPNGLEDFFQAIGRPKRPGEPAPEPFPRPENVLEIEQRTVFAAPPLSRES
ncbi:Cupin_2 domain-containing protein [Hyphomicrobiales bacterium]|nr:Cupin_2 domain-containing protein [Hyphomicrobiales bacterium]CAH1671540.1 Cupin_2 domain-containing protein [Hyphomicrobiales bacterium]